MFEGSNYLNLDAKSRLTLPAKYHDDFKAFDAKFTVTKNPTGCLLIFPRPVWVQFRERLVQLPMKDHWWKRVYIGSAEPVELDSTSRILIPPELREFAGIEKQSEVVLSGMGHYFELWDKASFKRGEREAVDAMNADQEVPASLDGFVF